MRRRGAAAISLWLFCVVAAAIMVMHARYTADLSAFLPRAPTPTQQMLVDQLRDGLASRLILIGIESTDASRRDAAAVALAHRLRANPLFVVVNNGEPVNAERDRELLFSHRYLLSESVTPERFTADGLRAAIQNSLQLLSSPAGMLLKELLPRDPTGEMLQILDQLGARSEPPRENGIWVSRDGRRALLVAETRATGSDTDGQELAVRAVREAFRASTAATGKAPDLLLSGPGVFAVQARATIRHELVKLSLLSTTLIFLLLIAVYRSLPALLLGFIPVVSGALAGVAAVSLGFGAVHGITLGFGVTLIGESVDYSIYLFVQSRRAANLRATLWPTIMLGVLTSIAGFASLLPSAFPGLAQLGLYSISGLIAAALVTRFVLPQLLPERLRIRDLSGFGNRIGTLLQPLQARRAWLLAVPLLATAVLYAHRHSVWNWELSGLSPVSAQDEALDTRLRTDLGAPDARYIVAVNGPDQESVLRSSERISRTLAELVEQHVIGGFESPSNFLPSHNTQQMRRASLPSPEQLRGNLQGALSGLPLRAERLEPFIQDVEAARHQPDLTLADLKGTSLASGADALLLRAGTRWSALLPLRAAGADDIDVIRVHAALAKAGASDAVVLDVKREADTLYSSYLSEVLKLSAGGLIAIVLLLLLTLRSLLRVLRVVAPLLLAVAAVAAALVLFGQRMTILHIVGMLLIVAVGSNYALFFDRGSHSGANSLVPLTLASLVVANAATVVGFGVLAFSAVPVLSALGTTVAPGALLALLFAGLLSQPLPTPVRTPAEL